MSESGLGLLVLKVLLTTTLKVTTLLVLLVLLTTTLKVRLRFLGLLSHLIQVQTPVLFWVEFVSPSLFRRGKEIEKKKKKKNKSGRYLKPTPGGCNDLR